MDFFPDIRPVNVFSLSLICLLILLPVSFKEQMFLIFMKFGLPICSFMGYAFSILFKKSLPSPRSSRLSPVFSCWCFIVLDFTFRYLVHFDLVFACSAKCGSEFMLSPCGDLVGLTPVCDHLLNYHSLMNYLCTFAKIGCP